MSDNVISKNSPILERDVICSVEQALELIGKVKTIEVSNIEYKHKQIALEDIFMVKSVPYSQKIIICYFENRKISEFEYTNTLKTIKSKLDNRFFYCHEQEIVNLDYVKALKRDGTIEFTFSKLTTYCSYSFRKNIYGALANNN